MHAATDTLARLRLVAYALKEYLFISSSFEPLQLATGGQDGRLQSVIQQCKKIYTQKSHRRGMVPRTSKVRSASVERAKGSSSSAIEDRSSIEQRSSRSALNKFPDLYVQGASSFTDLSSRRAEHESMIRGTTRTYIKKHSSSENLDQSTMPHMFGGGLDRVQSMEAGMSGQQNMSWKAQGSDLSSSSLPRSSSQGALQPPLLLPSKPFSGSTHSFRTSTHGLHSRQAPSYTHLDSASSDHLVQQLSMLEERVGLLAMQFLYERQDMFKQIMRASMLLETCCNLCIENCKVFCKRTS